MGCGSHPATSPSAGAHQTPCAPQTLKSNLGSRKHTHLRPSPLTSAIATETPTLPWTPAGPFATNPSKPCRAVTSRSGCTGSACEASCEDRGSTAATAMHARAHAKVVLRGKLSGKAERAAARLPKDPRLLPLPRPGKSNQMPQTSSGSKVDLFQYFGPRQRQPTLVMPVGPSSAPPASFLLPQLAPRLRISFLHNFEKFGKQK